MKRFLTDEPGANAIECGLIASLIAVVAIVTLGPTLVDTFSTYKINGF